MNATMPNTPTKPATPPQLVFTCKLRVDGTTFELRTHGEIIDGTHRWAQLSAGAYAKTRKTVVPVRIAFAMAKLEECRLVRWSCDDTAWIGGAAFDLDRTETARLTKFLVSLGVEIEDNTKGGK